VGRRLTILVGQIHSVGDKSAAASKETIGVDSRQPMPRRQRDDEVAMENGKDVRHHDQGTVRLLRKCVYGALDLVTAAHLCQSQLYSEGWRPRFDRLHIWRRSGIVNLSIILMIASKPF